MQVTLSNPFLSLQGFMDDDDDEELLTADETLDDTADVADDELLASCATIIGTEANMSDIPTAKDTDVRIERLGK